MKLGLDSRLRDCVIIGECDINIVIPAPDEDVRGQAPAGIQNLLKRLDSVSRFACTE